MRGNQSDRTLQLNSEIPHSRPSIGHRDSVAVQAILNQQSIGDGETVNHFSHALQIQTESPSGVHLTSTGAQGIEIALKAVGIAAGDDVIIPTYVCREVRDAVRSIGANAIYCDVNRTWRMTEDTVEAAWTDRSKGIILVSPFGLCTDASSFRRFGVPLIGDFCQAFDFCVPKYEPAVDRCDVMVMSFHATKCLAAGRGGAVISVAKQFAELLERQVQTHSYSIGFSDMQAALALAQLDRYDDFRTRREAIFDVYRQRLPASLTDTISQARAISPPFRFVVRQKKLNFAEVKQRFDDQGISVRRGVDALLHREAGLPDSKFPGAVCCFEETVSLPSHVSLSDAEVDRIVETALDVFEVEQKF